MAKVAIQGGVKNYLPSKEITVPKKAKSSKNHPVTELAYITEAEKNLLLKKDLHGSLNGKPNRGPGGIISLNGDFGVGESYGDRQTTDTSPEVGDRGGGYQERGDAGYNETIARIRASTAAANKNFNEKKAKEDAKNFRQSNYNKGYQPVTFGDRINAHNVRKRNAYIKRILKQRQDEMTSGLLQSNVPGIDVMDTKDYFSFAPSVKKYGPDGTGKYSQEFINDVLSGKRAAPEFFSEINVASAGGGMYGKGAAALANILGPGMAGPVTSERLNQLYNEYQDIGKIDPNNMNIKQMMEKYEPNRFKVQYGSDGPSDDNTPFIPINYNTGSGESEEIEEKEYDYRLSDGSQNVIYGDYGKDGYRTTAAEGGIMGTRARRAMGGIMNRVDKRQQFFLGGIGKAIKGVVGGVVDATKKVLKSDVGKIALAGAAFMYGPKLFGAESLGGFGGYGELVPKIAKNKFFSGALLNKDSTGFNPFKVAGILGLGGAALFGNKAAPNETNFSDRGGSLRNSQGQEGQQAIRDEIYDAYENKDPDKIASLQRYYGYKLPALNAVADLSLPSSLPYRNYAQGGRIGKAEGGLMDLGGMEKDYRAEGGFVPIGEYEKKDDVPARLSVNEFVFTADAVRSAGQGDIDKGAEIMENMMENLENGGTVSEESQGNKGAQNMFKTSERLGAVI